MAGPSLLGPPELHGPRRLPPPSFSQPEISDPFLNTMVADFNLTEIDRPTPPKGRTANDSVTYLSSGNPCIDLFFNVSPKTRPESIKEKLYMAWNHDPLTTLKLICNLRGVRGTGKSDKEGFYAAASWLNDFHPKTLACNVASVADFGCFKDLPEILYRLLEGSDVRKNQKREWNQRKRGGKKRGLISTPSRAPFQRKKRKKLKGVKKPVLIREIRMRNSKLRAMAEKRNASKARKEKKVAMAKKAVARYSRDPDFRFLYERVSDFFAECLKADLQRLKCGDTKKVSLAAKWCPSLDSSFDRATLLCESIARKVFPRESYQEYEGIEEAHYAYRVRDRLRKEVLAPLRKVLELPEVYIGGNRWDSLPYNRVSSVAMNFYKEKFLKHDGERFAKYLEDVRSGKAKIAAGALLPHEIILALDDADGGEVADLQWKRMVDDLLKKGKLNNCLAICGVSGTMYGRPMEVSAAMGLLISELSEQPWKGKLITFSDNPTLQTVEGDSLLEKILFVTGMEYGKKADFQKVFDIILQVAGKGNLKEDQMIKRVFVFSDMEFDKATCTRRDWETDYEQIVRKFTGKGYGEVIPEIVFWNLKGSMTAPVPATENGVALVSGYSKNLMKLFLDGGGVLNPETVMDAAISGEEYQKLVVVD